MPVAIAIMRKQCSLINIVLNYVHFVMLVFHQHLVQHLGLKTDTLGLCCSAQEGMH